MADFFLQLAASRRARQVVNTLGLPVPLPQTLERDEGPWTEQPLAGRAIVTGGDGLGGLVAEVLGDAGALVHRADDASAGAAPAEPQALVFDASSVASVADLRALHTFFQPRVKQLARSGRVVVVGRFPDRASSIAQAAARRALEGFVRSLGRELGRRGSTANLVLVEDGAERRLAAVLRFLLSPRAAFVSGQPLWVTHFCRASDPVWVAPLSGKVALVTGAARGIGAAIAKALAREGASVVVLDRPEDEDLGRQVAGAVGGRVLGCDIAGAEAPSTVRAFLEEHHGGVDIVVHNAGITRDKTLAKMAPELWDLTLGVNLEAILRVTDGLLPVLRPGGRIVALSSVAGIAGNVGQTNYSASKAGVIGFVEALAPRVASQGIAVNAIAPGFIETRMTDAIPIATREVGRRLANLNQGGLPEDIAEVATFLSSPGSSGLSGQVIRVCGGSFLGA